MCHDCDIALEVIEGYWGNGEERKRRLREAGYDYGKIQNIVNAILGFKKRHPHDYEKVSFSITCFIIYLGI